MKITNLYLLSRLAKNLNPVIYNKNSTDGYDYITESVITAALVKKGSNILLVTNTTRSLANNQARKIVGELKSLGVQSKHTASNEIVLENLSTIEVLDKAEPDLRGVPHELVLIDNAEKDTELNWNVDSLFRRSIITVDGRILLAFGE